MADYRQECANPNCSYTGFSGHSPGCYVQEEARVAQRERDAQRKREDDAWTAFFDGMSEDDLFKYITVNEDAIARMQVYQKRKDRAMDYLRTKKLYRGDSNAIHRLRNWQRGHREKSN